MTFRLQRQVTLNLDQGNMEENEIRVSGQARPRKA